MAMRTRDLTLDLPSKKLTVHLWSSDPLFDNCATREVRTTVDNTVQDIKELISQRSFENGGNWNPSALKLIYRYGELSNHEPLSRVLESVDDSIRLRVEPITDRLSKREMVPSLLSVNLRSSSGRVVHVKVDLRTSIRSLKYTLVDELHLRSLDDVVKFQYNGGVPIENDLSSLSELLELDTVPFGEINFFITLNTDFLIRLTSPVDNVLRTNEMSVNLDTTIFTVKKYILDQYTGLNPDVTTNEIKVIHFGRVLEDGARIRNISSPSTNSTLVLHFILQEPEMNNGENGFWTDLTNGKLFEFYPKEPNPHFTVEHQRTQRLREQFRNNSDRDENYPPGRDGPQSIFVPSDPSYQDADQQRQAPIPEPVVDQQETPVTSTSLHAAAALETETHRVNRTERETNPDPPLTASERHILERFLRSHRLPDISEMDGTTYDVIAQAGEKFLVDQLDTSECVYEIEVDTVDGPRTVSLSTSQAMINDTDPLSPYLMVNKAGYARLLQLGVYIQEPEVLRLAAAPVNQGTGVDLENDHQLEAAVLQGQAVRQPLQRLRRFFVNRNRNWNVQAIGELAQEGARIFLNFFIIIFAYSSMIQPLVDNRWVEHITALFLIGYAMSYSRVRAFLKNIFRRAFPMFSERLVSAWDAFGWPRWKHAGAIVLKAFMDFTISPTVPPVVRSGSTLVLDCVLFVAIAIPPCHDYFMELARERIAHEDALLAQSQNTSEGAVPADTSAPADEQDNIAQFPDVIEPVDEAIGATGNELHPEN